MESWRKVREQKEKEGREERERRCRNTVLITKRRKGAGKGKEIEDWIKDKFGKREIKIMKGMENKEAPKVFFRCRREKGKEV